MTIHNSVHRHVDNVGDRRSTAVEDGVDNSAPQTPAERRGRLPGPPVKHCGPLPLLAVGLLAAIGSFAVQEWWQAAGALVVQAICLPFVIGDGKALARRLLPVAVAAVSVAWSTVLASDSPEPLWTALTAALRMLVLVLPGLVLLSWVDPTETGDHLAQRLRFPARVAVAVVVALGRLDALTDSYRRIVDARRMRGLGPTRSPASRVRWAASTAFGLLVDAVRSSGRIATAMDARGFDGAGDRTWAAPAPWRRCDTVALVVGTVVAATPLLLRVGGAFLTPGT